MTSAPLPKSASVDPKEGPVLDILRMDITKDLLCKMAKEERCLFLALGHALNQVNALWKLVIMAILAALRTTFPSAQAWQPGYDPMLARIKDGGGHSPAESGKARQRLVERTGCLRG